MTQRKMHLSQQKEKLKSNKKKIIPHKKERDHLERDLIQPSGNTQESPEGISWIQYMLRPREGIKKRQVSTNAATIHGIAKKLIAREWSHVRGRTKDSRFDELEREAAFLKNRLKKRGKR
jgi:hypothetical protein